MHYLIDGHNLIGKMPDISLTDPDDEVKLTMRLKSWVAESKKRQVTLFFDGGTLGSHLNRLSSRNLKVIFAPSGKTADSLIISYMRQLKISVNTPSSPVIVKSSMLPNPTVFAPCCLRSLLNGWVLFLWKKRGRRKLKRPFPEKPEDPTLSEAEVQEWLTLFGPTPAAPPPQPTPRKRLPPAPGNAEKPAQKKPKSLRTAKTDQDEKLDNDEIAAWLDLFNDNKK
ncbi:MAG: NYN domain-containing protein [Chloroflexi bacterium]|nr:NYN domain-containing protein [Chloroflexota bacterium]